MRLARGAPRRGRAARRRDVLAYVALALLGALLAAAPAGAARPLELGFYDGAFSGPAGATWLARGAGAGADVVRIDVGWDAPDVRVRPAGFDARDPADPHYDFAAADAAIRAASADGLRVIAAFTGAPRWAEGKGRPRSAPQGTWRPDPRALRDYGVALARRYSGSFPDPQAPGRTLPRVTAFQLWNEPNLSKYLTPQWSGSRTAAPAWYRRMLNAFYAGVKSVDPGALVVTAGTAPFGDPDPGGERIMPARFVRDLLCLRETAGGALRSTGCGDPAHFDALAHHPYSVGAPDTAALNDDDVSIPDLGKLVRLLRAAERSGGALPRVRHPLWVTEVGYNTQPPNPYGVPVALAAQWTARTLELLWGEGVALVCWNTIVDQPPVPSYLMTSQSGVYYLDGRPKPTLRAFRFPFVAARAGRAGVELWGRAPAAGRLVLERRDGARWSAVHALVVGARETFLVRLRAPGAVVWRARVGRQTSIAWRLS